MKGKSLDDQRKKEIQISQMFSIKGKSLENQSNKTRKKHKSMSKLEPNYTNHT
jgi:hypothetical protein